MHSKRLFLRIVLIIIGMAFLTFFGLVVYVYFFQFPHETHSFRKYSQLRAKWDQGLIGHFPSEIPNTASLKRFSYFPGFMQGGAHIQLRLRLPAEQIRQLYSQFSAQRTKSFFGGDSGRHMNEKDGMPTTSFYTSDTREHSFPDDYEVMIFDRVFPESERPPGFYWNHGDSHGVAISIKRNEIVYWAESW